MCAVVAKPQGEKEDVFFNVRLKPDIHARMKALARENERTLAAEVRMAIRDYLERGDEVAVA